MLKELSTYTTDTDRQALARLIDSIRNQGFKDDLVYINNLEKKLEFAESVASTQISPDVVTMDSKFRLKDLDTGKDQIYSIVFPTDANYDEGKISILAPLATALLGNKRGDTVEVQAPSRVRRLKIEEILYQPEAAEPDKTG